MSAIKSEPTIDRCAGPSPAQVLAETRADVDRVLGLIPDNRLEARRVIAREWNFEPSANELQVIHKLAHDPLGQNGLTRELLRSTLAVRLQVDRELRSLLEQDELDSTIIARFEARANDLQNSRDAFDVQLRAAAQILPPNERTFLEQTGRTLSPPRDVLIAAVALTPVLRRLARIRDEAQLRLDASALPESEMARLAVALRVAEPQGGAPVRPTRDCLNALALCAAIHTEIQAWEAGFDAAESTVHARIPAERQLLLDRLRRYVTAAEIFAARLRQRMEADRLAGVEGNVESLRQSRLSLVAAFRKLARTLNHVRPGSVGRSSLLSDDDGLHQLLERSAQHDAQVDTARADQLAENERDIRSLKDAAAGSSIGATLVQPRQYDLQREKLRIRILSGITAILVVACGVVWGMQLRDRPRAGLPPVGDIAESLVLDETLAVGPMIFATVSRSYWNNLSDAQKLAGVEEIGVNAGSKGFETVYVIDGQKGELAVWSASGGVEMRRP